MLTGQMSARTLDLFVLLFLLLIIIFPLPCSLLGEVEVLVLPQKFIVFSGEGSCLTEREAKRKRIKLPKPTIYHCCLCFVRDKSRKVCCCFKRILRRFRLGGCLTLLFLLVVSLGFDGLRSARVL